MSKLHLFSLAFCFLALAACDDSTTSKNQGKLGYDCYPDGTCDDPWTCVQGVCRNVATNNINNTNNTNNDIIDVVDVVEDVPDGDANNQNPVCGNGVRETPEVCDGLDLGGATCESLGFDGGSLGCATDCSQLLTYGCTSGEGSVPTAPAEVVSTGTGGLLLRGTVLTPSGVLSPGEVLVANEYITCVAASCAGEPGAATATVIETNGIISAGLIDAHNHQSYNFFPEWAPDPPQLFGNRYEWADNPQYEEFILPYSKHRSSNTHFCPGSKWAELRCMAHGTTTMQGQPSASGSCINWGVRNADGYHNLGYDHMHGIIGSVRDVNDDTAATYMEYFTRAVDPITRFHVHMAEGISGNYITDEFDSWAGRDPRENRHAGVSMLYNGTAVLIHCVPLTESHLQEVLSTNSKIVWSPSSNWVLYGETAPIQRILQLGIPVAVAPDWTLSGEDDMLAEMRFARTYGVTQNIPELTSQKLWEMATWMAAEVVGLQDHIGRLEAGYRADLAVFGRAGANPYDALIDSTATDVRLVLINGVGFYGDVNLQAVTARNAYCETLDACGAGKYLCAQDSPSGTNRTNETYADIRTQLYNILEGIGYPADEQYGRGDELLELWTCQ